MNIYYIIKFEILKGGAKSVQVGQKVTVLKRNSL